MRITACKRSHRTSAGTSALLSFRTQREVARELEDGSWCNKSRARLGEARAPLTGLAFCLVITITSRQRRCQNRYHGIIRRRLWHQYEIHYCPSSPVANGKNPAAARGA